MFAVASLPTMGMAGEVAGGGAGIARLGIGAKVLWTGGTAARAAANTEAVSVGARTLEMTDYGQAAKSAEKRKRRTRQELSRDQASARSLAARAELFG